MAHISHALPVFIGDIMQAAPISAVSAHLMTIQRTIIVLPDLDETAAVEWFEACARNLRAGVINKAPGDGMDAMVKAGETLHTAYDLKYGKTEGSA